MYSSESLAGFSSVQVTMGIPVLEYKLGHIKMFVPTSLCT